MELTEQKTDKKKNFKVYEFDEVFVEGRATAEVGLHQRLAIVPSPEGQVQLFGTKCEHGGYIPATHTDPDRAPYCSICYPYLIKERV